MGFLLWRWTIWGMIRLAGGLFVFLNRRRDRMKLLYWDGDGIAIWAKRLEAGTFQMPKVNAQAKSVTLSATELTLLLRGIDLVERAAAKAIPTAARCVTRISIHRFFDFRETFPAAAVFHRA